MHLFLLLAATFFAIQGVEAQTTSEVSRDSYGHKMLKGIITRQDLATDTAFKWFAESGKDYKPYEAALLALRKNKDSLSFIVFGGTWCSDTRFIVPKFFVLLDSAGISGDRVTLFGVDQKKKTIARLSETFNITNVPTIIVLKNGKEIGRVVEYGKQGMFDKELGEVIMSNRQ
jgi:thiol-disulfide isomerase/thioredoxin